MGQFSVEKPVAPGSVLSGNQQSLARRRKISPALVQYQLEQQPHLDERGDLLQRLS